jgi:hypothetical protein
MRLYKAARPSLPKPRRVSERSPFLWIWILGWVCALAAGSATDAPAGSASVDGRPVVKDLYVIRIQDHKFEPDTLIVPAGKKIKLRVENVDPTPEDFESYDFNREKVVTGGGKIIVFIGPLKPGTYAYFGEFNPKTAKGVIVAK